MYNQSYEEYMKAVLGYPIETQDTYRRTEDYYAMQVTPSQNYELENMYPEVYKSIYPVVCDVCERHLNSQITDESVENMVNEVYNILQVQGNLNFYMKVENRNEAQQSSNSRTNSSTKKTEVREDRQRNNALLDIIRILIIRELLNRPQVRPPFPGPRPPMPPTRPPFPRPMPY